MLNLLRRLLDRWLAEPNDLHRVVRENPVTLTEAEMDRYVRYHTSDQWGR